MDSLQKSTPPELHPVPKWRRWVRHPLFPLLVLLVLTQSFRDEYPFSHYPMYSMPTARPLRFQYLADAEGKPLAHVYHTGVSPSQVGKMHGNAKKTHATEEEAALSVLRFLRTMNAKRPKRPLPERIRLMETLIGFGDGHFVETTKVLAEHEQKRRPGR